MREILFRGIRLDNGKWVTGYITYPLHDYDSEEKPIIAYKFNALDEIGFVSECDVCARSVCQYTGLTDKNGNKIFENDIIECRRKDKHFQSQIEWDSTCAGFMFQDSKDGSMVGLDTLLDGGIYSDFEVIGNIFDNPELIGE